jgi:hypothetical protein
MVRFRNNLLPALIASAVFPFTAFSQADNIPLPRLAVVDEGQRSVVMEDVANPDGPGVVPVLALVANPDGSADQGKVQPGFVASTIGDAQNAVDSGKKYEASSVAGSDRTESVLVREKPATSIANDLVSIEIGQTLLDYEGFRTATSNPAELLRVQELGIQELDLRDVSADAVITAMVHAANLEVRPPRGGFPKQHINIKTSASPMQILDGLADAFGIEVRLKGNTWTFDFEPASVAVETMHEGIEAPAPNRTRPPTPEERELERLSSLPSERLHFEEISLSKLILALAVRSEIAVVMPQEELPEDAVTIRATMNPFEMLQLMASRYGLGVEYSEGVWQVFPIDINEILPRTYRFEHNDMLEFEVSSPSFGNVESDGGEGGGGSGGGSGGPFSLPEENPLVERISAILSLPTTGLNANADTLEYIASSGGELPPSRANSRIWGKKKEDGESATSTNEGEGSSNIHYFAHSQELVVYATRQQHQYIEQVVKALDKPQRMINYTAYIYETLLNPTSDIGIDWTQTLNQEFSLADFTGSTVSDTITRVGDWSLGYLRYDDDGGPILDPIALRAKINLLDTDMDSRLTSKPSVTSRAMRPVELGAVQRRPVEASSSSVSSGGASTSSSQLGEIKIGTMIHAIGRVLNGTMDGREAVELYVVLEISEYVGDVMIDGNPAPITNSRNYNFTAIVPSGNTLAIGGVVRNMESEASSGVPVLGRIPLMGRLFSSRSKKQETMNLIAFITPTIVNDRHGNTRLEYSEDKPIDVGPQLRLISQNE